MDYGPYRWVLDPAASRLRTSARDGVHPLSDITAAMLAACICTGQQPGNHEEPMTTFKFALNASVVLITSLPDARKLVDQETEKLIVDADKHVAQARDDFFRGAGRPDLASRPKLAVDAEGFCYSNQRWHIGTLAPGTELKFVGPIERGVVIGRTEYANAEPQYLVRYRAADRTQTEAWFTGDAIAPDPMAPDIDKCRVVNPREADGDNSSAA